MKADQLTSKLQSAFADAQSLAIGRDNNQIEPVHLLQAMLSQQGGSVKPLLMQVPPRRFLIAVSSAFLLTPCPFNPFPKVPLSSIIANTTVSLAINIAASHEE
jgi:hypothetical protein